MTEAGSSGATPTDRPIVFIIVIVVISVIAAFVVGYLGLTGALGGGFPGQSHPPPPPSNSVLPAPPLTAVQPEMAGPSAPVALCTIFPLGALEAPPP